MKIQPHLIIFLVFLVYCFPISAKTHFTVAVIVDTSTSMDKDGMDPERASLLVTKLLADIVPPEDNLSVIRLLDLITDKPLINSLSTKKKGKCHENINTQCNMVTMIGDWEGDARNKLFGVKTRSPIEIEQFKSTLDNHLQQNIHNSLFYLAFRAAQGLFDQTPNNQHLIIWLSDGEPAKPELLTSVINELKNDNVMIDTYIFGKGSMTFANKVDLSPTRVSNSREVMKAFAHSFRKIVQAPYQIDHLVHNTPLFEIKNNVDQAWIVVYGDETLQGAELQDPQGNYISVNNKNDSQKKAGRYYVAILTNPTQGSWRVKVQGGGQDSAYAVIQHSALTPRLLSAKTVMAETKTRLIVGISAGLNGQLTQDTLLLKDAILTATINGKTITLFDNGQQADQMEKDGKYSHWVQFFKTGDNKVKLHLKSPFIDKTVVEIINVSGSFSYTGSDISLDFGILGVNIEKCLPIVLQAKHQGRVPFELLLQDTISSDLTLMIKTGEKQLYPNKDILELSAQDQLQLCLAISETARSSSLKNKFLLRLQVEETINSKQQINFKLSWQIQGLTFWQKWRTLILIILAIIVFILFILGFILPKRFAKTLAINLVQDYDDLADLTPQLLKNWKGTGIGFYRNARAFIQADYRISGKQKGALVALYATSQGNQVKSCSGIILYRETFDGSWEEIPIEGILLRFAVVYRIGEQGPYFKLSNK